MEGQNKSGNKTHLETSLKKLETTMATNTLPKPNWKNYFDQASKRPEKTNVEIEVSSLKLGNQIVTRWTPLHGMSYAPIEDTFAIFVEGLEHMIHHPQAIYIEENDAKLQSMEIIGEEDTRHIFRFRDS